MPPVGIRSVPKVRPRMLSLVHLAKRRSALPVTHGPLPIWHPDPAWCLWTGIRVLHLDRPRKRSGVDRSSRRAGRRLGDAGGWNRDLELVARGRSPRDRGDVVFRNHRWRNSQRDVRPFDGAEHRNGLHGQRSCRRQSQLRHHRGLADLDEVEHGVQRDPDIGSGLEARLHDATSWWRTRGDVFHHVTHGLGGGRLGQHCHLRHRIGDIGNSLLCGGQWWERARHALVHQHHGHCHGRRGPVRELPGQ
jgi:hypothetical protein